MDVFSEVSAESAEDLGLDFIFFTFPDKRYFVIPAGPRFAGTLNYSTAGSPREFNCFHTKATKLPVVLRPCYNPVITPTHRGISGLYLYVFTQIQANYTKPISTCQLFSAIFPVDNNIFPPSKAK
jgi:hypothetical protein